MDALLLKDVTKQFKNTVAVHKVNLSVQEGEFFGFIGPNGAGKSTTIRMILNFIYPTNGSISVFGYDAMKEQKKIKTMVGYVPSEVHYYPHMTVKELLQYAASFCEELDNNYLQYLCTTFEVDENKSVGNLSLGNKKKIAIIQALLRRPQLLILDEPTSGLDPLMQNRLFHILQEENKKGMTIFFSSHNLTEVQRYCHRVAIIRNGQIVDVKNVEELVGLHFVRVSITCEVPFARFDIPGLSHWTTEGQRVTFLYSGDMNKLIRTISEYTITDVRIETPTLEENFMSYYEGGEQS